MLEHQERKDKGELVRYQILELTLDGRQGVRFLYHVLKVSHTSKRLMSKSSDTVS